jgi:exopolyphosphatase/guanosine-5'-triphosphate,3'-diphosphate pyrophosphatase
MSFLEEIQDYSIDECAGRFKISYSEAENLQVSLLIYSIFIQLTSAETILVPETNIRNGLLLSRISNKNEELQKEFNSQITASAKNLLRKYHGDENHAEYVRIVATQLYDTLKDEIGLEEQAKILLEVAALLHDIGVFIRYDNHNLHSSYIVKNSEIFGLSRKDISIVSEIVKYHKGHIMPQDDDSFQMLPRSDRMMIMKLTSILRIADALDRGHLQKFTDLSIKILPNALEIHTQNSNNLVLEKMALSEKSEMFESTFGYKVILI